MRKDVAFIHFLAPSMAMRKYMFLKAGIFASATYGNSNISCIQNANFYYGGKQYFVLFDGLSPKGHGVGADPN